MAGTDPRPNYGSKRRVRSDGYIDIYKPEHPLARSDGYVFEHRMVVWDSGVILTEDDDVHHINHQRNDNRLENLEVKKRAEHAKNHVADRGTITNQYGTFSVGMHGYGKYCRGCRCQVCYQAARNYYLHKKSWD